MQISKKPCNVCGEAGDGAHFGAEACRACAAFFRRSVALNKAYVCKSMGTCVIQKHVRCMCRACRFAKCISVGMRKVAVQRHREVCAKSEKSADFKSVWMPPVNWSHKVSLSASPSDEMGMPTLQKINESYMQMGSVRRVIHNTGGDNIFSRREPKAIAYRDANNIHLKEIGLVADWVIKSFPEFERLHQEQKKLLYRNFFLPFMILECGYHCCLNDRTDILFLPSGDYIDCSHPETFYSDSSELMSSDEAVRMFGPSFDIYRQNVLDPMRREKVDNYEFFTLCSLVLWDHGLEGQADDCVLVARSIREKILREVLFYYRRIKQINDPSMRLANLLVLLPALQRSVRRFQEDVEIKHVFNVCSVEETFYELVSGRLSDSFFQQATPISSVSDGERLIKKEEPIDQVVNIYEYPVPQFVANNLNLSQNLM